MENKFKISFLLILLLFVFSFGIYKTYAYLTNTGSYEYDYTIGQINASVNVTGATNTEVTVVNKDLAYIHYVDDFITNKYGLLDTMSSEIKVSVDIDNSFSTRVKIMLPELNELEGLLYIIVDDSETTKDLEIRLQISGNYIQYGYEQADGSITWTNLIDISSLSDQSTNSKFRTLINTYNQEKLKSLYTGNKYTSATMNFRILFWGDYYSLSDANKPSYLERTYNFILDAKVIQAIDEYGGVLDYEND